MTQRRRPQLRSPRIQRAVPSELNAAPETEQDEPETARRDLAALQRAMGNAGFARMMSRPSAANGAIQRWTMPFVTLKSDEELVKDGLGGDRRAICEIRSFADGSVAANHRYDLIGALLSEESLDWRERNALVRIWDGFGDLNAAIKAKPSHWVASTRSGADLTSLKAVVALKDKFAEVIRQTALSYLRDNRTLVYNEQQAYGLPVVEGQETAPLTEDQSKKLMDMQVAAEKVALNQKAQEAARETVVGYKRTTEPVEFGFQPRVMSVLEPVKFDPNRPPDKETDEAGHAANPKASFAQMLDAYEASAKSTKYFLKQYPALYAVTREGSSEVTSKFAQQQSPEKARAFMAKGLEGIRLDINKAMENLKPKGVLDPLDLGPIAEGLLAGTRKPAGDADTTIDWSGPLGTMAAKEALRDHSLDKALKAMGYSVASEALFMLAPLTGGASLFVALAGLGVLGQKASLSAEQFEAMSEASKTAIDPDKQVISEKEVSQAEMEKQADAAALALAAISVAGAAILTAISAAGSAMRTSRLRSLVKDPDLLQRLRNLAKDDTGLERLLRRTNNHAALESLLTEAGSAAAAEELLKKTVIDYNKQLASGGFAGSTAGGGKEYGVFQGRVPGVVEPVAIKVLKGSQQAYFLNEMAAAETASKTPGGPKFYGRVDPGGGKLAFAMELIEGEVYDPDIPDNKTRAVRDAISDQTARDCQNFADEMVKRGRYTRGDIQGLVTPEGRWRPMDFGSWDPIPDPVTQPTEYADAMRVHNDMVQLEVASLQRIANENKANGKVK